MLCKAIDLISSKRWAVPQPSITRLWRLSLHTCGHYFWALYPLSIRVSIFRGHTIPIQLLTDSAGIIIYTLFRNRSSLLKHLKSEHSEINYVLFCRIFALTLVDAVVTIPLSVAFIYCNVTTAPVNPYISWADTHYNYSRIVSVPSALWRYGYETDPTGGWYRLSIVWRNIMYPFCAFFFLTIYGTSMDIVWYYWAIIWKCLAWFGVKRSTRTIARDSVRFRMRGPVFSSVVCSDDATLTAVEPMESR